MTHTLVAAFDTLNAAKAAKAQLVGLNIPAGNIQLTPARGAEPNATPAPGSTHEKALSDRISQFFATLFGHDDHGRPHEYAQAYVEAHRRGATVLTVTVASNEEGQRVEAILEHSGAIDIDERRASWNEASASRPGDGSRTLPVIEEALQVGKRKVSTGRVQVVTQVTEHPVERTLNLHEEHAQVERRHVDRLATAADLDSFKGGTIEVEETKEEPVVSKTARVVEEVRVGKVATEHAETVRGTVRRSHVDVQGNQGVGSSAAASADRDKPLKR